MKYKEGGVTASWAGDVYAHYTGAAGPPALMNFASPPQGVSAAAAADLRANVVKAKSFHAAPDHYQHAKTRTIHSSGLDTDMAVVFDPPHQPPAQSQPMPMTFGLVRYDALPEWKYRGATRVHRAEGDGTVPRTSANPLHPFVEVQGVEHSAACSNPGVQNHVKRWIEEMLS